MAPKKQKATVARAPASKKEPVVLDKKEAAKIARAEKTEAARQERIAKRAARSAANKAAWAANQEAARASAKTTLEAIRALPGQAKFGRPPIPWTQELEDTLFELISTGYAMTQIAELDGMPSVFTMLRWRQDNTHPFCDLYTRAKQCLVDLYEEQAQLAAVQPEVFVQKTRKQVVTKDGDIVWVTENRIVDNVARSALKMSAYQWTLSHLKPRKHGRNPDQSTGSANEQLKGLFDALKAGPADGQ